MGHGKSIITLRNGKVIEKNIPKGHEQDEFFKTKGKNKSIEPESSEIEKCPIRASFPQRLIPPKNVNQSAEIFKLLK